MKKTSTLCVKVSPELHETARETLRGMSTETLSRFLRACLDDLVRKTEAGETIAEPISLLTVKQRRTLGE